MWWRKMQSLLKKAGINVIYQGEIFHNERGDYLPCYVTRVTVSGKLNKYEWIDEFIQLSAQCNKRGILVFSVTERDANHKLFLEVANTYEGVTVTECKSRWHGDYKCWMIWIPTE